MSVQLNVCSKLVVLGAAFSVCGGCICKPAAKTILQLRKQQNGCSSVSALGLRRVNWLEDGDKTVVIGYGSHPRDAQNYCFFINEPYPAFQPRHLRIIADRSTAAACLRCDFELLLAPAALPCAPPEAKPHSFGLYTGTAECAGNEENGKLCLTLEEVRLSRFNDPTSSIRISGRVVAERASLSERVDILNAFESARQSAER